MTDPRTPLDLDAIAARHVEMGKAGFCGGCGKYWPCDASLLLAEVERRVELDVRLKREWNELGARARENRERAEDAEAQVVALAERVGVLEGALRDSIAELSYWGWGDTHYGETPQEKRIVDAIDRARAALAPTSTEHTSD